MELEFISERKLFNKYVIIELLLLLYLSLYVCTKWSLLDFELVSTRHAWCRSTCIENVHVHETERVQPIQHRHLVAAAAVIRSKDS